MQFDINTLQFVLLSGSLHSKKISKPVLEILLNQIKIGLETQSRIDVSCINLNVKISQFLVLDHFTDEIEVNNPTKEEIYFQRKVSTLDAKVNVNSTYAEKLMSGKALIHESRSTTSMIKVKC